MTLTHTPSQALKNRSAPILSQTSINITYDEKKDAPNISALRQLLSQTISRLNVSESKLEDAELRIRKLEGQIKNLETLATCDSLTGLSNRRGFEIAFEQEMDRLNRGLSMGGILVIIDLDNFKMINDTYGHLAGDSCLKLIGQTLANEIRTMDTASRLGGDEFVLLMIGANRQDVLARIQHLALQLNNLSLVWQGVEIPLRASIGVKSFEKGDCAQEIFEAADSALYCDKKSRKQMRP